jgi:hypothetical protein
MKNLNTIKSEIKKQLGIEGLIIGERKNLSFGMESVKVKLEKQRSTNFGFILLTTDWDKNEKNGIVLEINWV